MATILIIDDEPLVLKALARSLRSAGHGVEPFDTPRAFAARLEQPPPDLIICDYHMPETDGLTVLSQARRAHPGARLVLLSAALVDDMASNALRDGAIDAFLTKPWVLGELQSLIASLLGAPTGGAAPQRPSGV